MAYRPTATVTSPVSIDSFNKEDYVDGCTIDIFDLDGAGPLIYSHTPRLRGRGNSTWGQPQKPFKVRSLDRNQTPFGFAPSRDWALMADYIDESKMRSSIAFEIYRRATGRWAPHSHHVDLTWNGDYRGLYRYSETVDVQVGRVDIRTMKETDISGVAVTGPYFLETDSNFDDPGWRSSRGTPTMYDTPELPGVPEQEAYIQGWVEGLEDALLNGPEDAILDRIDLSAWVDSYLLSEITKQFDSRWERSCKWLKRQDAPLDSGRAAIGPPWDFDLSLGIGWEQALEPTGWWTRSIAFTTERIDGLNWPNWLWHVWNRSPQFRLAVRDRWDASFKPVLDEIGDYIDALESEIAPARTRDRSVWRQGSALPSIHTGSWLKNWINARSEWMDANLPVDLNPVWYGDEGRLYPYALVDGAYRSLS